MSNINRVTITGNLTEDPDRRTLGESTLTRMRVAVHERVKDSASGEYVDRPNFLDVSVWGPQATACAEHLHKGSKVAVDGRLRWREWDGEGGKGQAVEIVASSVEFLSSRRATDGQERELVGAGIVPAEHGGLPDDDIPF